MKEPRAPESESFERPNIWVIMAEQFRGDCLKIDGHPVLETPNLDALAYSGVRFSRAYTTCPSCIAARRSFLSGQFPSTHGMVGYHDGETWDAPLTLPEMLRRDGYQTSWIGRSMHQHPIHQRFGFEHMLTLEDYDRWLEQHCPGGNGKYGTGCTHNDYTAHPWPFDEHLHHTNWTVSETLNFLGKRDPSCPFFLVSSFLAAHPPLTPPAFYLERYLRTGVPEPFIGDWEMPPENNGVGLGPSSMPVHLTGENLLSARAGYYGLINHLDDQLKRIFNGIIGMDGKTRSNTIIVFISDHGEMLGDHYRWHKTLPYEGSARIPFLIKAPERYGISAKQCLDNAVCLEDLMPTLLEMAGVEIPGSVEGCSLLPLMQNKESSLPRNWVHIEHSPRHHSLTDGKEKFIWFVDGKEQFFDLTSDPTELHDLINDPLSQDKISMWRQRLIKELKDRPEGFSDGGKLIPHRPYRALLSDQNTKS